MHCAIGEVSGLVIGTLLGLSPSGTIALAIALDFLFGYALSALPLLRAGVPPRSAMAVVLSADTLSIVTMEVTDNLAMAGIQERWTPVSQIPSSGSAWPSHFSQRSP